jgi:hypothetical protein
MDGHHGGTAPDVWVSTLASLCWFFDVRAMAASHVFLQHLAATESVWDVTNVIRGCRKTLHVRPRTTIPI